MKLHVETCITIHLGFFFLSRKKQHCFAYFIFVYMRARTSKEKRASKQAIFAFVVSLRLFFSLPTITPLSFFLAYTRLYTAHRKGPCCAACTLACERVFSILFAAAAITIRHHIHSRRRRTHTYTYKSKAELLTHIHGRYNVCASCLKKKKRDEKAETYAHTHIYTYIRHVRAPSFAVDSSFS